MRALLVLFSFVMALSTAQAADKLQVVTSFSILDDITHQIGGDHIQISNMVGPDADAHTYEPTPDDAKALLKARVIIKNGLGFEPWLDRLVTSTETKATVVTASKGVISHTMEEDGETIPDPHAWHNLANAEIYVNNITKALVAADPLADTAHATLVRLLAAAGRYPDAERHYGWARELLCRDIEFFQLGVIVPQQHPRCRNRVQNEALGKVTGFLHGESRTSFVLSDFRLS